MELTSQAFAPNQPIPPAYTHTGAGISPPLAIANAPAGTQSLALIMHDPDAPHGDFIHWVLWNISGSATLLPENHLPAGALQGKNDFDTIGYGPPAPPSGTHRYVFDLYALNMQLPLPAGATADQLRMIMEDHIVGTAQLVGTVSA